MYAQSFTINGYTPAWAPEQIGKRAEGTSVIDGANFFWNLRGVQSGFGVGPRSSGPVAGSRHPAIMWVRNEPLVFCDSGVFRKSGGVLAEIYSWPAAETSPTYDLSAYKWTYAYVGTRHWFSNPLVHDLVYYDEFDDTWGLFRDDCWNGPIFGITHADNRLVVLLTDAVVWSKFDEGDKFDCGWQCGAGAQSLALIRYGQPYTVMPYNGGWLTFTSKGIMISVPTSAQSMDPDDQRIQTGLLVFEHQEASFDNMPLGPTAIDHIDEKQVVWLSTSGFYQYAASQGGGFGAIQPYAIEMGRFYKEIVIPAALKNGALLDQFCIQYARDLRWLFVSSRRKLDVAYGRAHVYQLDLEKWGCFDRQHMTLGHGRASGEIADQRNYARHFAIIDLDMDYVEIDPMVAGGDSWIRLAPFRLQAPNEDLSALTISSVQGIRLGASHAGYEHKPHGGLRSSWITEDETDYVRETVCKVYLGASDDDATSLPDEFEPLTMVSRNRNTIDYSCHVTGVNHTLLLTAQEAGEHFDLRHVEYTHFFAGIK